MINGCPSGSYFGWFILCYDKASSLCMSIRWLWKSWIYITVIMDQLPPGLAAAFPAFLTSSKWHWQNSYDLCRCCMAPSNEFKCMVQCFTRNSWCGEHDLQEFELSPQHSSVAKKRERSFGVEGLHAYDAFSDFLIKCYAGFYHQDGNKYCLYMDYIEHIRPFFGSMCISIDRPCHSNGIFHLNCQNISWNCVAKYFAILFTLWM